MSQQSYNGIILPYVNIVRFDEDAVGDEKGNTDWMVTKFDIQSQCLINVAYLPLLAPKLPAASVKSPADIMNYIYTQLMTRRKTLSLKFNGTELIPQPQAGLIGTVDAANGPIPISCTFTELTNTLFLLNYRIEASYWINYGNNPVPPVVNGVGNTVLNNRWGEEQDIDNCNFSTRTRNGRYTIRSDNAQGAIADQVRAQMAVVSVPVNCLRKNSNYKISPDGLSIEYKVVDQEVFKKPPAPAFEAEGEYTEWTGRTGAALRYGEIFVRLKGDRFTDQSTLLNVAIGVCRTKMYRRGEQYNPGIGWTLLEKATAKMNLYKNEVEFKLTCMLGKVKQRTSGSGKIQAIGNGFVRGGLFGAGIAALFAPAENAQAGGPINYINAFANLDSFVPGSDGGINYNPNYWIRGSLPILLQAAAYYDPSVKQTISNGVNLTTGLQPGQAGLQKE